MKRNVMHTVGNLVRLWENKCVNMLPLVHHHIADSLAGFHCIAAGLLESSKAHKFTMHWGPVFLKYAYQGQFRIVNYPTALVHIGQVIGEHYETKKVGMAQYKEFMPAFEVANGLRSESADIDPA